MDQINYEIEKRDAMYKSHWYPVCNRAKVLVDLIGGKTVTKQTRVALATVGIIAKDVTPPQLPELLE